jgi:hypothetical protein
MLSLIIVLSFLIVVAAGFIRLRNWFSEPDGPPGSKFDQPHKIDKYYEL